MRSAGLGQRGPVNVQEKFSKDAAEVVKVWGPADALCFSVPLYLRLPIRHIFSFVWTAYLSLLRGAREPPDGMKDGGIRLSRDASSGTRGKW